MGKNKTKSARPKPSVKKQALRTAGRRKKSPAHKLPRPYEPSYKFLDHTADIMIEAFGPNYIQALNQAAMAMFHIMGHAEPTTGFVVDVHASNREELVVYFLSQILSEAEAEEIVPCRVDILRYESDVPHIRAKVWGEKKQPRDAIKAVTFHELEVECHIIRGCRIRVLLDV